MKNNKHENIGVIILAGGKGTRMNSDDKNKVTFKLGNRPIILRIVRLFKELTLGQIIVVVGFAKKSIVEVLKNEKVTYAEQKKQLGTAHATEVGVKKLRKNIEDVIVLYGDDASLYPTSLLQKLIKQHRLNNSSATFITFTVMDPFGLGRIVRSKKNRVTSIIEERNATKQQKMIKEINPGCYIFSKKALLKYLPRVEKNPVSDEYYLTDIISLLLNNNEIVDTVRAGNLPWKGINTNEELKEAANLLRELKYS